MLNLPFLTQEATQFGLDLRSIGIQDGEVDFEDQQTQKVQRTIRFRSIDLDVQRMRDQRLLDFVRELANLKQPEPQGAALDFNLKSEVVTDNEKTTLRTRGRMVFPKETLELRKAWWNADMQFDNLSAVLLHHYVGAQWPVKSITGVIAPRFHIQGSLADQIRLRALYHSNSSRSMPRIYLVHRCRQVTGKQSLMSIGNPSASASLFLTFVQRSYN